MQTPLTHSGCCCRTLVVSRHCRNLWVNCCLDSGNDVSACSEHNTNVCLFSPGESSADPGSEVSLTLTNRFNIFDETDQVYTGGLLLR